MEEKTDIETGHGLRDNISWWKLLTAQDILTKDIVDYDYEGAGTEDDPYVVEWIENDPRNPMLWGYGRKWAMCISMAFATLVVSFCSSAYSGGILRF